MALTNKTILGKRILELQELYKDQQITISKKQDKIAIKGFWEFKTTV